VNDGQAATHQFFLAAVLDTITNRIYVRVEMERS